MSFPLSVYETRHGTPGGANPRRARVPMLAHRRMVRDNGLSAVPCIRPGQSRKGSLAVQGEFPHGSGQRPIRCPLHTTAASPCRALPRPALPRPAMPCWWKATSRNRDIPGSLDSLAMPSRAPPCPALPCPVGYGIKLLPAYHLKLSEHAAKRAETNGYAAFNEQVLDFLFLDFLVWENG